ncbi:DUF6851 domain-containing protein [Micromonospora sp. SL1-18]|uniref:DUF6851 domain-containing protein n=1 Tax=Micromonospora sp. SL1-18 TaxID=3399128 RepID=UPI003A4DE7BD
MSHLPRENYTTRRRSILLAGLGSAGLLAAGSPAMAAPASQSAGTQADFDFDTGNAIIDVFVPGNAEGTAVAITSNDATMVLRQTTLIQNAWFDAVAPYHPTAVGVYSRLGRRPASERTTNRHRNIAMLYASHRVLMYMLPQQARYWRELMTSVGLDPDDQQENTTTPVGIGNLAAKAVIAARQRDGMNELGDEGGRKYNLLRYRDYTGYRPVNTAYQVDNPSRWQPNVTTPRPGIFTAQQFVTPQMGRVKPYSYGDPREFQCPPPKNSDHRNKQAYKQQVDEVLAVSASLTDEMKMAAELYDNKFIGVGASVGIAAANAGLDLDGWVEAHMVSAIAEWDVTIALWHYKRLYDSTRPFSAIRHVYGDSNVTAWGGPGKGTVTDLPASQWRGYLNVGDHPEYPSGSAGICAAHAQALRRYFGTDDVDLAFPVAAGSSNREPGITPASDLVLRVSSWSEFTRVCGLSRMWGGVHFMPSIAAAWDLGAQIGDRAYEFVRKHIDGTA